MSWLALDLGSAVGWCVHDPDAPRDTEAGVLDWRKLPREERVVKLGRWLDRRLRERPLDVVFEEVRGGRGHGTWVIQRQEGAMMYLCARHFRPFVGVNPSELKRFATGSGAADKLEMMVTARLRLVGWGVRRPEELTEHEADAIMLAAWAVENTER